MMRCRFWIETKNSFRIKYDINERAKRDLDTAGINIPFPQQDIHHYYEGKWPDEKKEVEV
jgi:small conductance mechanosensitive channel